MSRPVFTDRFNSIFHFTFGIISIRSEFVLAVFLFYELLDSRDVNMLVDITEFLIGMGIGYLIQFII